MCMMIIQRAAFLVSVLSSVSVISSELEENSTGNLRGNSTENVGENWKKNVGESVGDRGGKSVEHVGENKQNVIENRTVCVVKDYLNQLGDNVGNRAVKNVSEDQLDHVGNNITTNPVKHVELDNVEQNLGNKEEHFMEHVGLDHLYHVGNNNKNMEHVGKDDRENTGNKPTTFTKQMRLKQLDTGTVERNDTNSVELVRVKRRPTHNLESKVLNPMKVEKISEGKNVGNSTEQNNVINKDGKVIENHGNSSTNQLKNTTSIETDLRTNSTDHVVTWNVSNLEEIFTSKSIKSVPTDDISFIPSYLSYNRREIDSLLNKNCGRRNKNGVLFGCFTKCCEENQVLATNLTCNRLFLDESHSNNYSQFNPSIGSLYSESLVDKTAELADTLVVPQGIPCGRGERFIVKSFDNTMGFSIDNYNGSLKLTEIKHGKHIFLNHKPILDYCIDNVVEADNKKYYRMAVVCLKTTKMYAEENNLKNYGFVSYLEPTDPQDYVLNRLFFVINGIVFSVVLIVYLLLPQLRTLNGWCIICFSLCSAVASFAHSAVLRGGWGTTACHLFPYTVVFFFLASFYWLNVMCFDIWWVFCGFRKSQMQPSKRGMDSKKFLYYSIYSWGSATAIIILVIATESLPFISEQWLLPKPDFGKTKCWFESKPAMWTYFYGPMASILVANLFFFMTTIHKILKISKETRVLTHDGNKRHDEKEKQRYMLYFKLFLVMGITWVSEVVSFHFSSRQLSFVWIITDVCNTLQGIPIFFIFVWKKKTLRLLNDRFCPSIRFMDASQTSTKTRETTNVTNNNIHSTEPAIKQRVTKIDSSFEMKNSSPQGNLNGER